MPDDPLVQQLLDELLDSDATPEQVCDTHPELLPLIRDRWRQMRRAKAELDAMFPPAAEPEASRRPTDGPTLPTIPGYEVEAVLGRGGMGVVFRAKHLRLNRVVALKMVLSGAYAGANERERFQREAEAVAALRHPNVVQIYDVGDTDGRPYFTMEFVEGGSLDRTLVGTPRSPRDAAALLATLAEAVQAAHAGGIVHRDLKPANILLTTDGIPKIGDFGLARRLNDEAGLTRTGTPVGTPSYMAPEQSGTAADTVGPAADIYALGVILYELLTGRPPFRGETADVTVYQVLFTDPVPPSRRNAKVPRDLETICLKCLHKDPRHRYATAAELAEDLNRFLRGEAIAARPEGPVPRLVRRIRRRPALAVAVAAVAVAAALLLGGCLWLLSDRAATRRAGDEDVRDMQQRLQESTWPEASAALQRATARLGGNASPEQRRLLDQGAADLALAERLEKIRVGDSESVGGIVFASGSYLEYEKAFIEARLGRVADEPGGVAGRVRESNIKNALVVALDNWSARVPKDRGKQWVLEVARLADRDPSGTADPADWRDRARDPKVRADKEAFAQLVAATPFADQTVSLLLSLENALPENSKERLRFVRQIQKYHPGDFWANLALGEELNRSSNRSNHEEAIGYYRAAVALRPRAAVAYNQLGVALRKCTRHSEAVEQFEESIRFDPTAVPGIGNLGHTLMQMNRFEEATVQLKRAIGFLPNPAVIPKSAEADLYVSLAECLERNRQIGEAAEYCRKAVAADPANARAHRNLRLLLMRDGQWKETARAWRASLAGDPPEHAAWYGYAELCLFLGEEDEYRRARTALLAKFGAVTETYIAERTGRACLLLPGTPEEMARATALADRTVVDDGSKYLAGAGAYFHFVRGLADYRQGQFDRAVATMRGGAAKIRGPSARLVLAMALHRKGDRGQARTTLASAVASYDWRPAKVVDQDGWIAHALRREAERMIFPDLAAFLEGKYQPRDNDERLAFLGACQFEKRTLTAARLHTDAFAAAPRLAEDFRAGHGYMAACAAAAASLGRGADAVDLGQPERARWRSLAREWLRTDLAGWSKSFNEKTPNNRDSARKQLMDWQVDPDLAGLRDPAELEKLPPDERQACAALWAEVAAVLKRTVAIK